MIYTSEHLEIQRSIRKFVDEEINPYVDEWEDTQAIPAHELFKKAGKAGFLGIARPVDFGGQGLDFSYEFAFFEALMGHAQCGGVALAIGAQGIATPALAKYGSDELRREFLVPTVAGDCVAGLAVTEPGGGSDLASLKTTARRDGDDYVISGSKMWTTNGAQADWVCVLANTSDGPVHKNKSLFCVPMKSKGVEVAKRLRKLGNWASDTAQIFFDEVRVPRRYLIGEENKGFIYQMEQFQEERLSAAAYWTVLDRAIRETIEYTGQRRVFGQPILDNQYVHFRLAELRTEVECLRSLAYETIGRYLTGEDMTLQTSMVKLKAGRLCREVTDSCLQFWGGMGYMWETNISRVFRDVRMLSIGGGADEVMLTIISKHMGTLPAKR
jgi:citronellyl-CoA dehydrogenase